MVTCIAEATAAEEAAAAAPDAPKTTAPLKLTHQVHSAGEAIVDLRGELDIATAAMAVSYVSDVIDNHHGPVTVDLTALAFCDAQGLAALVRMANHAKHRDRPFQIASPAHH
jgi:anti-anti-sigma factor